MDNYQYPDIRLTDYIDESLEKIKQRDDAAKIDWRMSGSFPSPVDESMIGMRCWRSDLNASYRLVRVTPDPYWQLISNESGTPVTKEDVEANYQPINPLLSSLSKTAGTKDTFPYFANDEEFQLTKLTLFARNLLSKFDANEVRDLLGLGTVAVLNTPLDGAYIKDGTISIDKINTSSGGLLFSTGDLKPSYATTAEKGWLLMDDGTIGSAISGASHADNSLKDLFMLWWNLPITQVYTVTGANSEKASNAMIDWNANKRLTMPPIVGRVVGAAGSVQGLTTRFTGDTVGEETHKLTIDEMPSHKHSGRVVTGGGDSKHHESGVRFANYPWDDTGTGNAGGDKPHNIMQPTAFVNWFVKI